MNRHIPQLELERKNDRSLPRFPSVRSFIYFLTVGTVLLAGAEGTARAQETTPPDDEPVTHITEAEDLNTIEAGTTVQVVISNSNTNIRSSSNLGSNIIGTLPSEFLGQPMDGVFVGFSGQYAWIQVPQLASYFGYENAYVAFVENSVQLDIPVTPELVPAEVSPVQPTPVPAEAGTQTPPSGAAEIGPDEVQTPDFGYTPEMTQGWTYDEELGGYTRTGEDGRIHVTREPLDREYLGFDPQEMGETIITDELKTSIGTIRLETPANWPGSLEAQYSQFTFNTENPEFAQRMESGLRAFWIEAYKAEFGCSEEEAEEHLANRTPVDFFWSDRMIGANTIPGTEENKRTIRPGDVNIIFLPTEVTYRESLSMDPYPSLYSSFTNRRFDNERVMAGPRSFGATPDGQLVIVTPAITEDLSPERPELSTNFYMLASFGDVVSLVTQDEGADYNPDDHFDIYQNFTERADSHYNRILEGFGIDGASQDFDSWVFVKAE